MNSSSDQRRHSASAADSAVANPQHVISTQQKAIRNVALPINCAFCAKQRAQGQTISRCPHHFYPSIASPTGHLQNRERKSKKLQRTQFSKSHANLQEQEVQARQIESLFISAAKGDHETIEWLMLSGIDVWQRDEEQRTALHIAAAHGRTRVVEFLVSQNADVNCQDVWGYTPLACALNNGHFALAEYLSSHGAKRLSLGSRSDLGATLCSLASQGELDELKILSAKGADLSLSDYDKRTPLHLAASEGHMKVCKYLVKEVNVPVNCVDRFGITPLQAALDNHHAHIASFLQEYGGATNDRHSTMLLYNLLSACASGNMEAVVKMVESDAVDVNLADYDGRTPLHLACANGRGSIVAYLLQHGAFTDVYDRWGADPYHEAAKNGFREVVEILDPENRCSMKQSSPLDCEMESQNRSCISDCCQRFGHRREIVHEALNEALLQVCTCQSWSYGEIWIPNRQHVALQFCNDICYISPGEDERQRSQIMQFRESNRLLLVESSVFFGGAPIRNGKSIWLEDLDFVSQSIYFSCPMARAAGLHSGLVIPIRQGNQDQYCFAYAIVMKTQPTPKSETVQRDAERVFSIMSSLLFAKVLLQGDEVSRVEYLETIERLLNRADGLESRHAESNLLNFSIRLLFKLKIVDQFFEWGQSMLSEDHKSAMVLLLWLVKHIHLCPEVADRLNSVLRFLYTVSPLMEHESPIRSQADMALDDLRAAGFEPGRMPFFGHGLPRSPVFSHIQSLRSTLDVMYRQFKKHSFLEEMIPTINNRQSISYPSGEIFDACGSHQSMPNTPKTVGAFFFGSSSTPATERNEVDQLSELCTSMLQSLPPNELVTTSSLLDLHKCLKLDPGVSSGEFRTGLVVGSHMFYKFYRVFAPADEVPELVRELEEELRSSMSQMAPAIHAYYVFTVIVCYIHPFEDGNGRIGRVLGNMILKAYGYPAVFRSNHKVITLDEFLNLIIQEKCGSP